MKKILAFLLTFALMLSMSTLAFATGSDTPVYPTSDPTKAAEQDPPGTGDDHRLNDEDVLNHTYRAYPFIVGDVTEDGTLSNYVLGGGIALGGCENDASMLGSLFNDPLFKVDGVSLFKEIHDLSGPASLTQAEKDAITLDKLVKLIEGWGDYSVYAEAFAKAVSRGITGNSVSYAVDEDGHIVVPNGGTFQPGYYLIVDTELDDLDEEPEVVSNMPLLRMIRDNVEETVRILPKADNPVLTKKVLDVNDSEALTKVANLSGTSEPDKWAAWFANEGSEDTSDETIGWQDSADYDIGDHVPFLITYTLGRISDYDSYFIRIFDMPDAGLTYDQNVVIKVDGNVVDCSDDTDDTDDTDVLFGDNYYEGAEEFLWKTGNFNPKAADCVFHDYSVITVEYTMTLNEDAKIGPIGNGNWAYASYPNRFNSRDETNQSTTPFDIVTVFTYQAEVNKVDQAGEPLGGAKFTLFKKVMLTETEAAAITEGKNTTTGENVSWKWLSLGEKEAAKATGEDSYTADWVGLDDGDYKLVETQTPAGYNTGDDLFFTVEAEHDEEADEPELLSLSVSGADASAFTVKEDDGDYTGLMFADIENNKGSTLPETGGIGTKIFYVTGGILLCAAAVLLVTKKRYDYGAEA